MKKIDMKYHVEFDIDFKRNQLKGLYIAFEGINTSGKTTHVEELKNYFKKKGKEVVITSEPNDSLVVGKLIREILRGERRIPLSALQYLYTADRIINHETIILPALEQGKIVLSSRTFWSSLVYGILDKGVDYTRPDADLLLVSQGVLSMYHDFILPDYLFFLDISLDTVMQRMEQMNKDRDIYEKKEKLSQLISGYRWVAQQFPEEFTMINAEKPVGEVTKEILDKLPK